GDKAYVIYPKPRNEYSDQGPYLVATVGAHTVTAFLSAHKGAADGPMGEYCRGDKVKANEKEDCKKMVADKTLGGAAPDLAYITRVSLDHNFHCGAVMSRRALVALFALSAPLALAP